MSNLHRSLWPSKLDLNDPNDQLNQQDLLRAEKPDTAWHHSLKMASLYLAITASYAACQVLTLLAARSGQVVLQFASWQPHTLRTQRFLAAEPAAHGQKLNEVQARLKGHQTRPSATSPILTKVGLRPLCMM